MGIQAIFVWLSIGFTFVTQAYVHNGIGEKSSDIKGDLMREELMNQKELANRLLHRLMDVAYETFKDFGGSQVELKEVQRKRALITTCYFQAVSCY